MENKKAAANLGKIEQSKANVQEKHVSSTTQADTLFSFTKKREYLIETLKNQMLSPRYNTENVEYLSVESLKSITFPMKCFCDINLHKISLHLDWYGYYGIAFPKEWGIKNHIQPIHYINARSALAEDLSIAFSKAIKLESVEQTDFEKESKNYLLHQLMYSKPYSGLAKRTDENGKEKEENKCFTDESEWRFIPNVVPENYPQVIVNEGHLHPSALVSMSNSMSGNANVSLAFDYSDIKYIFINEDADFEPIIETINTFQIEEKEKQRLISKIIVWESSRGDF